MFTNYEIRKHRVWLSLHFCYVRELTPEVAKACVGLFPASRLGMYSEWAAASRQATGGGSPPRMGSQPPGLFQSGQGLYLNLVPFGIRPKLIIRAYNTKGGQDTREIQVHPKLKEFLEEYSIELKGRNPHLFPGRHGLGHIHKASADRILREALRRVDLDERGMSSHSFRRTALTWMSDASVPLRHIQSISGHRSLAALERYLGVTEQQKENAISTLVF